MEPNKQKASPAFEAFSRILCEKTSETPDPFGNSIRADEEPEHVTTIERNIDIVHLPILLTTSTTIADIQHHIRNHKVTNKRGALFQCQSFRVGCCNEEGESGGLSMFGQLTYQKRKRKRR